MPNDEKVLPTRYVVAVESPIWRHLAAEPEHCKGYISSPWSQPLCRKCPLPRAQYNATCMTRAISVKTPETTVDSLLTICLPLSTIVNFNSGLFIRYQSLLVINSLNFLRSRLRCLITSTPRDCRGRGQQSEFSRSPRRAAQGAIVIWR